jgi:hypothetical protein
MMRIMLWRDKAACDCAAKKCAGTNPGAKNAIH